MAQGKKHGLTMIIGIGAPRTPAAGMGPAAARPDAPAAALGMGTPERRRQHAADVEAAFLGRPQPHGTFDEAHDGGRVSAQIAGYMELEGAHKDGECDLVAVPGGVSGERGCCNLFEPEAGAEAFECGDCEHFAGQEAAAGGADEEEDQEPEPMAMPGGRR